MKGLDYEIFKGLRYQIGFSARQLYQNITLKPGFKNLPYSNFKKDFQQLVQRGILDIPNPSNYDPRLRRNIKAHRIFASRKSDEQAFKILLKLPQFSKLK